MNDRADPVPVGAGHFDALGMVVVTLLSAVLLVASGVLPRS